MNNSVVSSHTKTTPYWWDHVPRPVIASTDLPARADVVVIGSGYTGLHAALQIARGGRHTVIIDAEDAGWGCSTRNGGQISTSIKPSHAELARRHGVESATRILQEGRNSLAFIEQFVKDEQINCDFGVVGRFHAAHNAAQYEILARSIANQPKGLEVSAHMVPRTEQRDELGTDAYFGGIVMRAHASIDPARYHAGLLAKVQAAGCEIHPRTPATKITRSGADFIVTTPRGQCTARNVVIATNGYTGTLTPWLRRRVIPIGSYVIATEPLAPDVMARIMPKNRIVSDTRKVVYYFRASPDRTRILFGGRVSHNETDPMISGPRLHDDMVKLFPELSQTRISHSWCGLVAYSFDELAHTGIHEGMHYAMGYCGSGVGMASYLGMRLGQQVLGLKEGHTALNELKFPTMPFYTGNPWFLAPSVMYYRWKDSL